MSATNFIGLICNPFMSRALLFFKDIKVWKTSSEVVGAKKAVYALRGPKNSVAAILKSLFFQTSKIIVKLICKFYAFYDPVIMY